MVDEEKFFHLLVKDSATALENLYNLKKTEYPHITSTSEIRQIVMGMPWVSWDQCLEPITLKEIDRILALKAGERPEKKKVNTIDNYLAKKPETEESREPIVPQHPMEHPKPVHVDKSSPGAVLF